MAEYSNLSATINAQIRANGVQAITGPVLNAVLTAMVNVLGDGYRLNGVAVPADNPGSPDNRVAYLAAQDGTYTNFGGLTISGEVALLLWDSAWTKETLFSIDTAVTSGSGHLVTSGAVDDALSILAGNIAAAYMQLVPGATEGNLAEFGNAGQVRDAGLATSDIYGLLGKVKDIEGNVDGFDVRIGSAEEEIVTLQEPDYHDINQAKLCGQPMKLFGAGTPQESVVPDNWIQLADGGYDWNGAPSAIGQEYINTAVASGGHYIAVRDSDMGLKWYNC